MNWKIGPDLYRRPISQHNYFGGDLFSYQLNLNGFRSSHFFLVALNISRGKSSFLTFKINHLAINSVFKRLNVSCSFNGNYNSTFVDKLLPSSSISLEMYSLLNAVEPHYFGLKEFDSNVTSWTRNVSVEVNEHI